MTTTEQRPRMPALGAPGETCTHCGALLAVDQRYCLNCGLRRAAARVDHRALSPAAAGAVGAAGPAPGGPAQPPVGAAAATAAGGARAISPLGAAVAIGLLLLATLLGAVIGAAGKDDPRPVVVGGSAPAAASPTTFTSDWAEGDGWTIQILTLPLEGTTPAQVAQAKADATARGAADVGALDSTTFASLEPGTYVIYSGRFTSRAKAEDALKALTASYPEATVIRVSATPAGDGSSGSSGGAKDSGASSTGRAAPAAKGQLQPPAAPEEALQKSKKLPNELGTGGAPPPKDDAAPAGGGDLETIG